MADTLLHSSAVYFYAYDPQTRAYAQQTDSVVGCALLASSTPTDGDGPFKLLFYNSQKQPLLQLSVTTSTPKCTPQQDNYVNFLDDATQKFYSMRFKDAAGVTAFLSAVAFVKAQQLAVTSASFAVLVDDLALGKEDGKGHGLAVGDVAGIALTVWQGQGTSDFFTENPLDIAKQQAAEVIERDGDVKRVRLVEKKDNDGADDDPLAKVLAMEALVGMQKNAKRLVTVVVPQNQQWFIASIELVKVKKATRSSATTTNNSSSASAPAPVPAVQEPIQRQQQMTADETLAASANDELIQRMANLSRAGSKGSGLIASLSSRSVMNGQSPELVAAAGGDSRSSSRKTSFAELQAAVAQKFVPVFMPGMQLPDGKKSPTTSTQQENSIPQQQQQQQRTPHHESLAAKVIAPLKDPLRAPSIGNLDYAFSSATTNGPSTSSTSSEMDRLIQEQSDLAQLRKQLEESKRKLQEGDNDDVGKQSSASGSPSAATGVRSSFGADQSRTSSGLNGFGQRQSPTALPSSSLSVLTPSRFTPSNPSIGAPSSSLYGNTSPSRWTPSPSSLDLVPSFQPSSSFLSAPPPPFQPTPANSFNPSLSSSSSYNSRSLVTTTPGFSNQSPGTSMEVENGILRLQRSSTSIESSLQDIQSKIDRLLNSQNSLKTSKYAPSASSSSLYGSSGLSSSSGPSPSSSSSSSSILLKNLEKALTQRDQLQELNGRLQESREQMESTIEDLQNQHEALQMENRNLLDKLQNGNHLQQEKFRLELRNVQQQLGHTQEQMLVYQEENFRLRNELAAKDDQLLKEKAQLQDDARKQLESLQRQLEAQVRQDSKDSVDKVLKEKSLLESQVKELAVQKQQWEQERDAMTNQLRLAQSQIQDERSRSQSVQDTRVQELQAQLQQMSTETRGLSQQVESLRLENRELEELLAAKEHEVETLQETKSSQEYAALSELLKEFMNDIYFHFQDAFDEDTEFTGKEIVMAIRKILKQNTMDILTKLEEFWQLQAQNKSR